MIVRVEHVNAALIELQFINRFFPAVPRLQGPLQRQLRIVTTMARFN